MTELRTLGAFVGLLLVATWGWPVVQGFAWLLIELEPIVAPWREVLR